MSHIEHNPDATPQNPAAPVQTGTAAPARDRQRPSFDFFAPDVWRRFWAIASPYWREGERRKAWGFLIVLIVMLLAETQISVMLNNQAGEMTSALAARDSDRFWHAIMICLIVVAVFVPTRSLYYFVRDTLGNHWRRWLSERLLGRYFHDRRFYELTAEASIDNPDQRIAEDVNTFTQRSLYFLLIGLGSLMQLVAFSWVLWQISHMLVYVLVAYTAVGTWLTVKVFGAPLMRLNFFQLKREADFRFSLVRVRENAESIAFHRGEQAELKQVRGRFKGALRNYQRLLRQQLNLNFFQQAYNQIAIILPNILIANLVLSGELEVGQAIKAAGAFLAVLGAVSIIIDNFEGLSRFTAGIERIHGLLSALPAKPGEAGDSAQAEPAPVPRRRRATIATSEAPELSLQGVTLKTPDGKRELVRDLSFTLQKGDGLLIVGESGSGKSSLLRAIAGLWRAGHGSIRRPPVADSMFLPQRPYMQVGSLRSQLLYPQFDREVEDAVLLQALHDVNLPDLAERSGGLDAEVDWAKTLSLGEQQRLAFARVLITQPRFVILDEATSALDRANEARLYQRLLDADVTLISIAHRAAVLAWHTHVLELTGAGRWQLHEADGFSFDGEIPARHADPNTVALTAAPA
ncbi:ABC transporter ATP-binding protein/permease [Ottowia sp.]|uniref:ABC transporter ATP-binding protein/permease n=1 Tax=Ottowia sp. TaxID=1898956 RepID=UPI002CBC03BD|nr:ABC transporter ATP-binding protein/permease [Ottowia sp.]HOB67558.1 ABC transporter ATP-binding protein/permease [Ottowia sp.]HPZ57232.1 ABC transporter ATP-binding protein/permease [Ottowia sp.]HQD47583.1 ABC transporter ATP-binding protein/permease [Ottowia sp.]